MARLDGGDVGPALPAAVAETRRVALPCIGHPSVEPWAGSSGPKTVITPRLRERYYGGALCSL